MSSTAHPEAGFWGGITAIIPKAAYFPTVLPLQRAIINICKQSLAAYFLFPGFRVVQTDSLMQSL